MGESEVKDQARLPLDGLLRSVDEHRPDADRDLIIQAYSLAEKAHDGQKRKSGNPYIVHPTEVARIIAELGMDDEAIVAALLHDVIEDTGVEESVIEREFGAPVKNLVKGVTKLDLQLPASASARQKQRAETARAAESLRRMLLAMADDIRVIVIKLADRLHNMRTLEALSRSSQIRIASETMDVYAPLAARLGIYQIKWELEDLAFKTLHPKEFKSISDRVARSRQQRDKDLKLATKILEKRLEDEGLEVVRITGRAKHLFSIFNKHVKQSVPFAEIYDLIALRVITRTKAECYQVLGLVHALWIPMSGLFFDYIGQPKPNGYQSLHTKVVGPSGDPLEVQIRTEEMHQVAEFGVAAHWSYKEGRERSDASKQLTTLRQALFDWSSDSPSSSDFLRAVSSDLFSEQVFVFTPKGDVLDLPAESTPIDFAFRIHTDLALTLSGAKVNGNIVPLTHQLQNGDVVELMTKSGAKPSLDWLKAIKSQHARSKLRGYFRREGREENAKRGRQAIEQELKSKRLNLELYLSKEHMTALAEQMRKAQDPEEVYARVGEGLTSVKTVVDRLRKIVEAQPEKPKDLTTHSGAEPQLVRGALSGVAHRRAKCCSPLPGDDLVGFIGRRGSIVIHRRVCPNLIRLAEQEPERMSSVAWESSDDLTFPVRVRLVTVDRDGLLSEITAIFSQVKAGVAGAKIRTATRSGTAEIDFDIRVRDAAHLRTVISRVGRLSDVLSVLRMPTRSR